MAKDPEITTIDNRTEWYMKHKGIAGVTTDYSMLPVLCDTKGRILTKPMDLLINKEFYKGENPYQWPRCPITGKRLPKVDNMEF